MKLFKRFLMGLGTVLLLALSLQLFAPQAVHAVVSTLVTIANTSSNPVLSRNVDNPATYPFSANLCIAVNSTDCDASTPQFFVVPSYTSTGVPIKRLVLQGVSGRCQGDPTTIGLLDGVQIASFAPPDNINNPSSPSPYRPYQNASVLGTSHLTGDFPFSGQIYIYAAPGDTVHSEFSFGSTTPFSPAPIECQVFLTGYLVSQ
jgi:hypothetical protein